MNIQQLYSEVSAKIIAELEAGAVPWLKCWKGTNTGLVPANAISKRAYSGINVPILWFTAAEKGYEKHAWLTYQQAAAAGGQVRKGEKSKLEAVRLIKHRGVSYAQASKDLGVHPTQLRDCCFVVAEHMPARREPGLPMTNLINAFH